MGGPVRCDGPFARPIACLPNLAPSRASRSGWPTSPSEPPRLCSTRGSAAGTSAQSWFYDVVGASAVVVALIGVHINRPDRRLPWYLMADRPGAVRRGRHHVELLRGHRRVAVPLDRRRPLPRRLPVHRRRAAPAHPPTPRRRRPRRRPRRGDPDDGRRDPLVDVLHPAARRRLRPRSAVAGHQPRLPDQRPAAHRRRDGPPHDARARARRRSVCWV